MFVKQLGFEEVQKTYSATNAVEIAESYKPDLMLVDINLNSELSGIDIVKDVQEQRNVKVIYITGNSDMMHKETASETNFISYLVKPIDFRSLKDLLLEKELLPQ